MGLVGIGVGASEGLRVEIAIVKDVESTQMLAPSMTLADDSKDGLVSMLLNTDDISETDIEEVSTRTPKLTDHT